MKFSLSPIFCLRPAAFELEQCFCGREAKKKKKYNKAEQALMFPVDVIENNGRPEVGGTFSVSQRWDNSHVYMDTSIRNKGLIRIKRLHASVGRC